MSPTYYRCEWKQRGGVVVEVNTTQADTRPAGFYATESEARTAEAARMTRLANELYREAQYLTRDERGD